MALAIVGCTTTKEIGGKPQDDAGGTEGGSEGGSESSESGDESGTTTGPVEYDDVVEPGPELAFARSSHRAVLLEDGTVFIGGGWNGEEYVTSVEIFRPEENDVVPGGELLESRPDTCAVRLLDGRVMMLGGRVATSEIWDPQTQSTVPGPSFENDVGYPMCVITSDGTVLVADSYVSGKGYLIERWRPGDEAFARVTTSVTELDYLGGHSAALLADDNRILLIGGGVTYEGEDPPPPGTDYAQVWDIAAQSYRRIEGWSDQGAVLALPSGDAIVFRNDQDEGLVAARFDGQSETLVDISPGIDAMSITMASMRVDDVGVLAGGLELDEAGDVFHSDRVLRWDLGSGGLEQIGTLGEPRSHGSSTRLQDGRIVIIGGATDDLPSKKIDVYH
ncbi:MAG TPA: kelch repeat-containing protein [Nannocystaceae bacterium]|nr:kelch repeat-containing protein [Nannocystaceae bacterium]